MIVVINDFHCLGILRGRPLVCVPLVVVEVMNDLTGDLRMFQTRHGLSGIVLIPTVDV